MTGAFDCKLDAGKSFSYKKMSTESTVIDRTTVPVIGMESEKMSSDAEFYGEPENLEDPRRSCTSEKVAMKRTARLQTDDRSEGTKGQDNVSLGSLEKQI